MSVIITEVKTKKELRLFVKFPMNLYKDSPYYVPNLYFDEMNALDPAKNPMCKYSKFVRFLAWKDGKVVGRVAGIINEIANRDWDHKEVRFGWFDFVDDREVSKALLEKVIEWGKSYGMTQISGPLGFTDFDNEGMVVEGFDQISSFMLKFNYPYYREHMEALGYEKVIDWQEYRIFVPEKVPEKVSRIAEIVADRYKLHVRNITKRDINKEKYGQKLFDLINRTYCELYDFTVLPPEVIDSYVDTYLGFIDLRYVVVIENEEGKLVALAITMPSLAHAVQKGGGYLFPFGWWHIVKSMYLKHEEALELMLIAVDPDYRNKGVNAMLFNELIPRVIEGGFKYGESNAELETNNKVQNQWDLYEKQLQRVRRIFGKSI
ncbi:MAG: GNAT family N-acetyltransferase [Bacteroidales bacterium]|nr:GNAT family N-acetyltransferase [Bacteroidales bacterium]MBQ1842097.1 GNAT family N-acetyltransferase [Bacteroidales bacterium]MBQ3846687.1 GNAT family N-acetyltransferase [Bacteroidales bacterium]